MRNLFLQYITVLTLMLSFTNCSTKINTVASYQNNTFVYGILQIDDTAHYIRIQKSFLDQNRNAYNMAKIADSSFYLNLDVKVKEINPVDSSVHNTFTLDKVNMNNEGYPKDSGIFFTDPSYAYKFRQRLSPNYHYRLLIHNLQTGETDSAQTVLLSEDSTVMNGFLVPFFIYLNTPITFGILTPNPQNSFIISGNAPDSTFFMQAFLRLHWVDKNIIRNTETDRYYDWNYQNIFFDAPVNSATSGFSTFFVGTDLINELKQVLGPAPANVKRYLDTSDVYIYAGTAALYNYQVAAQQYGTGIGGSGIQPIFSNISGKNAYGIFTSRARRYRINVPFLGPSFTLIVNSPTLDGTGMQPLHSDH